MVSSMNAKVLSRTCRSLASVSSFFSLTIPGSRGIGVVLRISRDSTTAIGSHWHRESLDGTPLGGLLQQPIRSADDCPLDRDEAREPDCR
jgi:hypothetical protein